MLIRGYPKSINKFAEGIFPSPNISPKTNTPCTKKVQGYDIG